MLAATLWIIDEDFIWFGYLELIITRCSLLYLCSSGQGNFHGNSIKFERVEEWFWASHALQTGSNGNDYSIIWDTQFLGFSYFWGSYFGDREFGFLFFDVLIEFGPSLVKWSLKETMQ